MRLSTLEIQAERLQELLKQAGKLQDLFTIEQELADVTYQIESLKGTLKKYDSLVDYSTIHISIQETREYRETVVTPVTFGEKVQVAFANSVKAVGRLLENFAVNLIGFVPFLIIWVPVGLIILIIVKVILRKRHAPKLKKILKQPPTESEDKEK